MIKKKLSSVAVCFRPLESVLGAAMTLCLIIVTTVGLGGKPKIAPKSESAAPLRMAAFNQDGSLHIPESYRRWEHVGTRIKPDGRSVLDGSQITTPQVMDTYVLPGAFDLFKKQGTWPDGTQIVKEISIIRTGEECNKNTLVCTTPVGSGIFQASYIGMGVMVKDQKRFPSEAGNWGYFAFRSNGWMYEDTATIRPQQQCASCHMRLASNTDYVFSSTHIGLLPGNTYRRSGN